MRPMFLLLTVFVSPTQETIQTSASFPDIEHACYNKSTDPLEIDCADSDVMHMEAFGAMEKMWKKNSNEHFDPSDIIFVDNNRSLRFSSLLPDDSGVYTCCRRISPSDGYHCIDRKVKVVDGDGNSTDVLNATEGTNTIYAWNIDLISEDILYGREGNAYFLKLFYENATDVYCSRDGEEVEGVETNKPIPEPLHHDVVIQSFNSTLHSGTYECNGTVASGNKTNVEQANFTIVESMLPNFGQERVDSKIVEKLFRSSCGRSFLIFILATAVFFLVYDSQ